MNSLLEQWNDHIVRGNQLSRELENIEVLIEKSKGEDICFTAKPNGATYITVLSSEKMQELRETVVVAIMQIRDEKAAELKKLMGIQVPETSATIDRSHVLDAINKLDPVEEKLSAILEDEAKRIEDKPVMTIDDIRRMYHDEGKSMKEIAEYYGVTKSVVNNFIYNNHVSRKKFKDDGFLDAKVEARRKERP